MAQRRSKGRGASRQQDSATTQPFLRGFVTGLASGLFVAFLLYIATLPADSGVPSEGSAEPAAARAPSAAPTPEYEFYELLPKREIRVDVDPAELPKERAASDAPRYLLQAGSFRQADDADRRRAELLLLGLEPRVEETHGQTGRWYRVIIGPFESRSAMARARSLTAQQDIDTLLMQRKAG
ncbi:MAG: SPOR domain-containing protein [Halieaceae bacterium]|jgi:cell division protein FtsN|nr:SPOR domain-containing protein [Halieaceae bacterium]